ncbi:MAG TPA: AsmA family protein [Aestuariivirga sp.]|nr:AsmA family protein [Aestuariivirga sp.]
MRKMEIGAGLAVAGLAGTAAVLAMSPDFAVAQLQAYVAERTARSLTVSGGAHIEFTPSLAIRLDDVMLSNPPGMEGQFVSAGSLRLPIAYGDLMQRRLPVGRVMLTDAAFNFVIDGEGRANWTESGGKNDAGGTALSFVLENATAAFLDQRHGQAFGLNQIDAAAEVSDAGELTLHGNAVIAGQRAKFETYVKSPARAAGEGSPATLTFESALMNVSFDGRLAAKDQLGLAGQVTVSAADLRAAARWLGAAPGGERGFKDFTLSGKLDGTGKKFKLRKAEVGFDAFKGTGVAILDFGKPVPSAAVSLDTDAIDLNPYLAPKPAAESEPAEGASAWDAAPLGYDALRGADIKVQLATKKLVYGAVEMGPATIEAALTGGRLNASIADAGLYGGKADAQIVLDGSGETPAMEVTFTARGVSARDFFRDFAGLDRIEGEASLTAVLKSRGDSQQEMISTLRGPAAISVNKGAIRGLDASAVAAAAVEAPLAGWPLRESNVTEFDSLSAEFAIDDGIAGLATFTLDGDGLGLAGRGEVDLLRRNLDLAFAVRLGEAEIAPVDIGVTGPWDRPKIAEAEAAQAANGSGKPKIVREIGKAADEIAASKPVQSVKRGTKKLWRKLFGN